VFWLVLSLVLVAAEGARLLWYRLGDPPWAGEPVLTCELPEGVEAGNLDGSRTDDLLSYDEAVVGRWKGPGRDPWTMDLVFLEYTGASTRLWHDMFRHSPEICLRAGSGAVLRETFPSKAATVEGRELVFSHQRFDHPLVRQPVYAFKSVWLAHMDRIGLRGDEKNYHNARLAAARARFVPPGAVILAIVEGPLTPQEAWEILRERLLPCLRFEMPHPPRQGSSPVPVVLRRES